METEQNTRCVPLVPSVSATLRLTGLNHISRLSSDLAASTAFFIEILGFKPIRRPSFDFDGSWLFGFGIGLHLIYSESAKNNEPLNPRADHLSFTRLRQTRRDLYLACRELAESPGTGFSPFQCESLELVERQLQERRIPFEKQTVVEHGIKVSQVFFKDPGGTGMIEVCNCDCLPIILLDVNPHQVSSPAPQSDRIEDWRHQDLWQQEALPNSCSSRLRGSSLDSSCSSEEGFEL